jgi:hypothetical protein
LQSAIPHRFEGLFREDPHGVRLTGAEANHLLLHQGLETVVDEIAIEVVKRKAQHALAGAAIELEYRERVARHLTGDFFEGGDVEGFFVAEIVIEEGFVDAGRCGDGTGASAGQAVFAELVDRGLQDAFAGRVGSVMGIIPSH